MKVLLVTNAFPKISESFIFNQYKRLSKKGIEVNILIHSKVNDSDFYPTDDYSNDVIEALVDRIKIKMILKILFAMVSSPAACIKTFKKSLRTFKGETKRAIRASILAAPMSIRQYDVVHFELSGLGVYYYDALPLIKPAKVIVSCRGFEEQVKPLIDPNREQELSRLFLAVDKIHCVSKRMTQNIAPYIEDPTKLFVNHPSIEAGSFQNQWDGSEDSKEERILVTTGRLHWVKGIEFALLAVKRLVDQGLGIKYLVIGDGPEKEKLLFEAAALGLEDDVVFLGYLKNSEVKEIIKSADIYLQPSLSEGLSNATLEAMSMELPVVATDVGGTAEAIEDGVQGFLVLPRSPEAIHDKLKILMQDDALRKQMGEAGRKKILSEFSLERQTRKYLAVFEKLLEK